MYILQFGIDNLQRNESNKMCKQQERKAHIAAKIKLVFPATTFSEYCRKKMRENKNEKQFKNVDKRKFFSIMLDQK